MPVNKKYLAAFEFEGIYHVYNRTNNRELLFQCIENYEYFLNRFAKYISPIADTYAWTLIPNHFHLLIKIKSEIHIVRSVEGIYDQTKSEKQFLKDRNINRLAEMAFKRLFTSYAMSYNNMFNRKGNLFYRTFKRIKIWKEVQFTQILIYIHANAVKHNIIDKFDEYRWTSYHLILNDEPTKILKNEIIEWFGNREELIRIHHEVVNYYFQFEDKTKVN